MLALRPFFLSVCCFVPAACGGDDGRPGSRAPDATPVAEETHAATAPTPAMTDRNASHDESSPVSIAAKALPVAFVLPRLAAAGVMSSRSMVAEAVYFASAQTGGLLLGAITRTGTVTVTQSGAVYSPSPSTKLVVKVGDQVDEFESIDAAGGNGAATAAEWLMAPHRLSYKHRIPNQAEATVSEKFDGTRFEARLNGWATLNGIRYDVDLTSRGSTQGQGDLDGRESQTRFTITGTIHGDGVDVAVSETDSSNYASAVSIALLYSQRGWADQAKCTITSTAKAGGETFRFDDVQVESGAKEKGGRSSSGVVATSGRILRDDKPFAECMLQNGVPVAVAGANVIPLVGSGR
jgi:hypothetical protein